MSSTGTPPPGAFVNGTSNPSQVYLISAGTRRLIPDAQTFSFLSNGKTVQTLSDAALNAIPLGAPLPSRKDGTLLTQKYAAPPPRVITYFMANGQRREIGDIETLLLFQHSGRPIVSVEAADLTAIPEGPALPTRRDGTLYQGSGEAFAYIMQGGQKRAFPDATTLRDADHDFTALASITASELGFIPDGPPFPSTSKFLSAPSAAVPLVLLPVRLETRFQNSELWLRIYPDDVHVNTFEPELTAQESAARASYLGIPQSDMQARKSAFAALARQFGGPRAAWITSANAPSATKSSDWTQPASTNVLPERWIVMGYIANKPGQVLAVGPAIQDSIAVGPAPNGPGLTTDDGMRWMIDFNRAIEVGMAFRIPLTGEQQRGFNRIVVLGLKTNLPPNNSATRLAGLFEAHHYTDNLELLRHNTPTNNTETVSSGFTTADPDYTALFNLEQGSALCPSRPTADGDRLARALNIPPTTLAHVGGANGSQGEQAQAINTVLWPATWGYYLNQIVNGAVPTPDVIVPAARDHFIAHVRARGHFPALRIGRQPYGILPVCWSSTWKSLEGRALDTPLYNLLTRLRSTWESAIANVPRLPNAADPEATLVSLLGMSPSSTSFVARNAFGPEYSFSYFNFVQNELPKTWWDTFSAKALSDAGDLSSTLAATRLASIAYVNWHRPLSDVLVAPDPLDSLPAPAYVSQLAGLGWQALRDVALPAAPIPILFLLLRHAALREYLDTALDLLIAGNAAHPPERLEAELVAFPGPTVRSTAWDLLQRALPNRAPVGTVLDGSKKDPSLPSFSAFWQSFGQLAKFSAADLDVATREVFDLASYRLDSWITSLAQFRLDQIRAVNPNGGIVIGGYGWLEDARPQPAVTSSGFVHAPSLNQAATCAVLRSGFLSHQDGAQGPYQIDLSSARVRLALHLLDGIREGQSLGALLGYRLERTLHDSGLDAFIDTFRSIAPLENTAQPLDVVDGLTLYRKLTSDPNFWQNPGLPAAGTPQFNAVSAALSTLKDALDSVADLALAESVHQLVRGNVVRGGATLDSIARGDAPPLDIDFVTTPRSGTALTYRLMTTAFGQNAPGWTTTARAQAEPRLNAWAAALFGDPSRVRIRVQYMGTAGTALANIEIGLDKLALAPLDVLSLADTGQVAGEFSDRIRRAAAQARPSTVPANAPVKVLTERDPAWPPQTVGLTEWLASVQAVAKFIGGARPLEPSDLVVQGGVAGSIDVTELQKRADSAEASLRAALKALQTAGAKDTELLQAAAFGIAGSFPSTDASQWPAQIALATAALESRTAKLDQLAAGFVRGSASPESSRDHDVARLQAIFGSGFVVLPVLASDAAASWSQLWANSNVLLTGDSLAAVRWMQRASRVQAGAARLDSAVLFAEALAGKPLLNLQVAQLPIVANEHWVGLDAPAAISSSRLSLVNFSPTPFTAGAPIAGLLADEWIEVAPSANQITGLSFQYSDPTARAPQSILLAVRPDAFPDWTLESLEGSVLEALDLAKIRTVDPDALGALGDYLPALYFAYNTGAPGIETVSVDFKAVLQTSAKANT